jgi:hypothetical protein
MGEKEKELLAHYHHTISEQLNSRLSESPKFFGLLIIVSTGYGYVLSNDKLSNNTRLFALASLLSYAAVLWASWYLAALGYAFRILQNIQRSIEQKLEWNKMYDSSQTSGENSRPPWPIRTIPDLVWLLPGIYHPHAAGLSALLIMICVAYGSYSWKQYPNCCVLLASAIAATVGIILIWMMNRHYLKKFRTKTQEPKKP